MSTVEDVDKVQYYISPPTIQISARVSVFEAAKRMKKYDVGAILVTEGKNYVGIFTEVDLLKKVVAQNELPGSTSVSKVMTKELLFIDSEATMIAAFLLMQKKNVRNLIVKESNDITGVLSIKDIAKYYVNKFSKA
jgi:signal-transduction protein with cAMP-binding, CBS, and nucleotidyltransferase domain